MAASAAKKKPAKRMTQREKDNRARVKKELQAKGILPPDKPRLNRKKFAKETWEEFWAMQDPLRREFFLYRAISTMVGPDMRNWNGSRNSAKPKAGMSTLLESYMRKS